VAAVGKVVKEASEAMISCKITGLAAKATVQWVDDKGSILEAPNYTPDPGTESSGTQTSTLKVKATAVKEDKSYSCRVKSSDAPSSPHSDTSVDLIVYGKVVFFITNSIYSFFFFIAVLEIIKLFIVIHSFDINEFDLFEQLKLY
jgi:hypothetical protein